MTRLITISFTLICVSLGVLCLPALSQTTDKAGSTKKEVVAKTRDKNAATLRALQEHVKTEKLQDVTLNDVLEYLSDAPDGKPESRLVFLFDRGFAALLGPDEPDPTTEKLSLPKVPNSMKRGTALRLALAQVAKGNAMFLVRQGQVEIIPRQYGTAAHILNQPTLLVSFEQSPLQEVLHDLTDETGLAIHLDPAAGKKAQMPISAMFRNASLEDALVTVTEMAELKFVVMERSIFVTTPDKVDVLRNEEKQREAVRKEFRENIPRMDIAR